jgi:hypothetical protein
MGNSTSAVPPSAPVIHLTSYEDRDRGESRKLGNTAPRMLYDPKSGSMVAVSENKAKKIEPKEDERLRRANKRGFDNQQQEEGQRADAKLSVILIESVDVSISIDINASR